MPEIMVMRHGVEVDRREYPPGSGRDCRVIRYRDVYYAVPEADYDLTVRQLIERDAELYLS